MEAQTRSILGHHLPYELHMLECALNFILTHDPAKQPGTEIVRNLVIEAFCTHARNINEFIGSRAEQKPQGEVAAFHFTDSQMSEPLTTEQKIKINHQISHLYYDRTEDDANKIGVGEMVKIHAAIINTIGEFGGHLKDGLKPLWKWKSHISKEVFSNLALENKTGTTSHAGNFEVKAF